MGRITVTSTPSRRPSQDDVGRLAGVSHQTVSRFLNGQSYVGRDARERIESAIRELNYRPNRSARSLATNRSETVGVITMGGPGAGSLGLVLQGIGHAAEADGFSVSTSNLEVAPDDRDAEELVAAAFERFLSEGVEGLVIVSAYTGVMEVVKSKAHELPIVIVFGEPTEGVGTATIDSALGGGLVAAHLLELGHRRVVMVRGPANRFDSAGREEGFREQLSRAGAQMIEGPRGDWTSESGYRAALELRDRDDFTAIFAANDQMALGVLHAFSEIGRHAPRDFSLVGYDDLPDARHYLPPLTTVRQDFEEIGARSFVELRDAIRRESFTHVSLQPELIIRQSTRPFAG